MPLQAPDSSGLQAYIDSGLQVRGIATPGGGGGGTNGIVYALDVFRNQADTHDSLMVGGAFTAAGVVAVNNIASWNSVDGWEPIIDGAVNGVNSYVFALDRHTTVTPAVDQLWVGGNFTTAGVVTVNHIAYFQLDPTPWVALALGVDNPTQPGLVRAIHDRNIGGDFVVAVGVPGPAFSYAHWTGTVWQDVDGGLRIGVRALTEFGGNIIAAGNFNFGGSGPVLFLNKIAELNAGKWQQLDNGANAIVVSLHVHDDGDLYVGGRFSSMLSTPAVPAPGIARWDGSAWDGVGTGVSGSIAEVDAIASYGGDLIVAGGFTHAGGVAASNIARWDGGSWYALGSGTNSGIGALQVFDGDLYAGGWFSQAGGVAAAAIARWNGSTWSAVA